MPFTPVHILAILPIAAIKRLRLPFGALAIGSMIPDVPLFTHFGPSYQSTHSIPGLVTACLPMGLSALVIFRFVMVRPLLDLLPPVPRHRIESHFGEPVPIDRKSLALASIAIVAGSATHGFWDSFTHEDRWGTRHIPALNAIELTLGDFRIRRYELLQYGCSALGLPILAGISIDRFRRIPHAASPIRPAAIDDRTRILIISAIASTSAIACFYGLVRFDRPVAARLHDSVTKAGLAMMTGVLAYCLAYHWKFRRRCR